MGLRLVACVAEELGFPVRSDVFGVLEGFGLQAVGLKRVEIGLGVERVLVLAAEDGWQVPAALPGRPQIPVCWIACNDGVLVGRIIEPRKSCPESFSICGSTLLNEVEASFLAVVMSVAFLTEVSVVAVV